MPVTVMLSRRLYEVLGPDVANELVTWFNQVDATYRADLRELNELNFARFDAKLGERLAESDARWERRMAEWERRLAELDAKWEGRLTEFDAKWAGRWTELDAKLEQRVGELRREMGIGFAELKSGLVKWMFVFWAPTALAVAGLLLRR